MTSTSITKSARRAGSFTLVPVMALVLGGCVVAVGSGYDSADYSDHVEGRKTVDIPLDDHRRITFACPKGYVVFTRGDAQGNTDAYGCERSEEDRL